jgi:GT2 family glycosyltransferase
MDKNHSKKISVVIVNYNNIDILDNCLSSIIENSIGIDYEIIVIDNGSESENLNTVIEKYSEIKFIKNITNKGFAAANNQGIDIAKGEYILFLNNDTIFIENTLEKILEYSNFINNEFIIGCKLLNEDRTKQISIGTFYNLWNLFGESFFLYKIFKRSKWLNRFHNNYKDISVPTEVDFVKGAFLFCTMDLIKKLTGFDERFYFYGEEADLCRRAREEKAKIIYFPGTSIIHLGGAATKENLWFKFKNQGTAKIQFFQKYFKNVRFFIAIILHYLGLINRVPIYLLGGIFTFNKDLIIKSYYYFKQIFVYPENKFK